MFFILILTVAYREVKISRAKEGIYSEFLIKEF